MTELGITAPELARRAGVDPTTVRALIKSERWPRDSTRRRISRALGWPDGEVARIALTDPPPLSAIPTEDLVRELCRRLGGCETPDTWELRTRRAKRP